MPLAMKDVEREWGGIKKYPGGGWNRISILVHSRGGGGRGRGDWLCNIFKVKKYFRMS